MLTYAIRRLLQLPIVLFVVSVVIVGLLQFLPPSARAAAYVKSEQQLAHLDEIIKQYNLDAPFYVQYWTWLKNALQGNLGFSRVDKKPVLESIATRLPVSAELVLYAFLPTLLFSIWLGTLAAIHRDKFLDQLIRVLAVVFWSLPTFVLGIALVAVVYGYFKLFGIGRLPPELYIQLSQQEAAGQFHFYTGLLTIDGLLNGRLDVTLAALKHLVLPTVTLVLVLGAQIVRVMRSSMLDELGKDYVRTARAKGLPEKVVYYKHARRNALIPVITLAGLMFAFMLNGVVITETIFNLPGLGQWAASAALQLDQPSILGFALFTAFVVALANIAVDLLYALVDPRIRYE